MFDPGCGRPDSVLRRDLGRDVHPVRSVLDDLADKPLAVAVAIGEGRVDEIQPEFE